MTAKKEKLFLITNDDGIHARGLKALIELVRPYGKVMVIAPEDGQSGMSHAITVKYPIRLTKLDEQKNLVVYSSNGTPVDCVKLALSKLLDRKPDLIIAGINHGSNSSSSIIYSGTMAAAIEGCVNGIPSIGFSLLDYSPEANFRSIIKYAKLILENALEKGIPQDTCLNVNFPVNTYQKIRGIKICRQNKGVWKEEFDQRQIPVGVGIAEQIDYPVIRLPGGEGDRIAATRRSAGGRATAPALWERCPIAVRTHQR